MSEFSTPWWFWIIAGFALLWNLFGLFDYSQSMTMNLEYLSMVEGMAEFIQTMPIWAKLAWGLAIICSVLGSLCLLLRKKLAFNLYTIAVFAMVISFFYQFTAANTPNVPASAHLMTVFIWAFSFFLIWFAKRMTTRGILN